MRGLSIRAAITAVLAGISLAATVAPAQGAQRVYVVLADSVPMSVAAAATAISEALGRQGWQVLIDHPVASDPLKCNYVARVIVTHEPAHSATFASRGGTAAYAIPVRISVFDDERGVHVAMVNPLSLERTVVAETGLEAAGQTQLEALTALVIGATRGHRVNRAFGQSRDRAVIGKTMGVMAGGPFASQIETIQTTPGSSAADLRHQADVIWQRLQQASRGKWQLKGVYRLDLADQGVVILGVSGAAMESKAFAIVGYGDDDTRSDCKCPGIAYAAAFPLELVVQRDGANTKVGMVAAMFRMKMYFEDAGRMKFARNMGMPGSISDELRDLALGRTP